MSTRLAPIAACLLSGLVLGAVPAAALATGGSASRAPLAAAPSAIIDDEAAMSDGPDCNTSQLTGPYAVSPASITGGPSITLDALVLLDVAEGAGIAAMTDPMARARAQWDVNQKATGRLRKAAESYAALDVNLVVRRFELLQPLVDGKPRARTTDANAIIALAKKQFGGSRPGDVDVVYVLTDLDIQTPALGNSVAGLADCIGGIGHPDRAFAVGETPPLSQQESGIPIGPVTFYADTTAKIFGHELGHLLGAQHHYQECGTAVPAALANHEPGPCTLMTNLVDFQSFPFSTLNGAIVRGHAEKFAGR